MLPSGTMSLQLSERLFAVLENDQRGPAEKGRLVRLMVLLAELPPPPDPGEFFPKYDQLKAGFLDSVDGGDADHVEESFLDLYAHLHMHEAPYTPDERRRVDETGGYWCHAGGLSPILKAGDWIRPDTASADLGAGNGLQGLLLQKLYPHRRTVQVEISHRMVEIGRRLQEWLEIPNHRVQWVIDDVQNASVQNIDFLYLYRPVRSDGPGRRFYERLAAELDGMAHRIVIFSIADCLRDFLSDRFEVFYSDGHLTCFRNRPG
jgi:hypothetical protein